MKIAVYCGSDFGTVHAYKEAATQLGQWIASSGNTLVYGGGDSGLMGETAKQVHSNGNQVIGVIPGNVGFIAERPQPYCTEVIITESMSARKQKMLDLADAFIALPGGTGTLDEITEALTLTKIGVFRKACIFFNRNGFYEPVKTMFAEMEKAGFLTPSSMSHVLFSDDPLEIEAFIKNYSK